MLFSHRIYGGTGPGSLTFIDLRLFYDSLLFNHILMSDDSSLFDFLFTERVSAPENKVENEIGQVFRHFERHWTKNNVSGGDSSPW